ncbi:hypothetical protein [Planobispora takensis]|uniref:Uncharacterized protein n=1 Tax=Planobispora takensis TaxID=1367882 RepID=A0A8J3T6V6_9ACTN|nr:hypothetical protein [Planobispora takensis]GII06005.1 hypothetical protein Pta02_80130 [Planobispora takensis]
MRQLSALDSQFLGFETAADVASVAGLAILGREVSRDELLVLLKDRTGRIEQLRQRLRAAAPARPAHTAERGGLRPPPFRLRRALSTTSNGSRTPSASRSTTWS